MLVAWAGGDSVRDKRVANTSVHLSRPSTTAVPRVEQYNGGDVVTATYDEALRRLKAQGSARFPESSTARPLNDTCIGGSFCAYQTKGDERMASDGWQPTAAFLDGMLDWQRATLTPTPFIGTVECADGDCRLEMQLSTPTVRFIVVRHDVAPSPDEYDPVNMTRRPAVG